MTPPDWITELRQNARAGTGPCAGCPAHEDGRSERVNPGLFDPDGRLMFVTIEPSHVFDWAAFDGWPDYNETVSRKFLEEWTGGPVLAELLDPLSGLSMEEAWMADAIKCPPPDGVDNLQRDEAFAHCRAYLQEEIEAVAPEVIVALGNHAGSRTLSALGREPRKVKAATECGRIVETDPPLILSTHWSNNWLYQSPRDYWGSGWLGSQPHLQDGNFERYMDVVRESIRTVLTD